MSYLTEIAGVIGEHVKLIGSMPNRVFVHSSIHAHAAQENCGVPVVVLGVRVEVQPIITNERTCKTGPTLSGTYLFHIVIWPHLMPAPGPISGAVQNLAPFSVGFSLQQLKAALLSPIPIKEECTHVFQKYTGLTETYEYCTKCDTKLRKGDSNV